MKRFGIITMVILIISLFAIQAFASSYARPEGETYFQERSTARLPLTSISLDTEFNALGDFLNQQQGTWQSLYLDIRNYADILEAGDSGTKLSDWLLTGMNSTNTNNGVLYWNLTYSVGNTTVSIYKDSGKAVGNLVAQGIIAGASGTVTLTEVLASGISGSVVVTSAVTDTDSGNTLTVGKLKNAVTAIGATVIGLYIPSEVLVYTTVSVPSTITPVFERGGSLNISTGAMVTFGNQPIAGNYQIFSGSGILSPSDGLVFNSGWFISINEAVRMIGATAKVTLKITEVEVLTANLVATSNISIKVFYGGSIVKASTYTVTFNSTIEAGLYQWLSGFSAGDVVFGSGSVKEVYPQWWGAKGDGLTDDTTTIQSTIDSLTGLTLKPTIYIPSGTYLVTADSLKILSTQNKTKIVGEGKNTVLKINGSGKVLHIYAASPARGADIVIENLSFDGTTKGTNYGLYIERGLNCRVRNIWGKNLTAIIRTSYAKQIIIDGLYTSHNSDTQNVDYLIYDNGDGVSGSSPCTEDLVLTKIYGCADITNIHLEQVDGLTLNDSVLFQYQAATGRLYNIYMRESHFININNIHAYGSGSHGVYFLDCWKFNLSNIDCAFNGSKILGSGIRIEDSTGTGTESGYGTISNVYIDKVSKHGIEIIDSTRLTISNITIYAVSSTYKVNLGQIRTYDGINISGTGTSRIVIGNVFVTGVFDSVTYTRYGIRSESGTNYIECTGCEIINCYSGDISFAGNNSYYELDLPYIVTTTDATPTVAWNNTLSDNTAYKIDADVIARPSADASSRAIYERVALVYRTAGGGAAIQGATIAPVTVESDATWNCDITVSGNDVRVMVTGIAAATIKWRIKIKVLVL